MSDVKKKQLADDNQEDEDKDEDDEDEDDNDGDNDLKGVKQSDIMNQIVQFVINIRTVAKQYIGKTKAERITLFSEGLNERIGKIREYLVQRTALYKGLFYNTKSICVKTTTFSGTYLQIRDQKETILKSLLTKFNLLIGRLESDGMEYSCVQKLKLDLSKYLEEEKFF